MLLQSDIAEKHYLSAFERDDKFTFNPGSFIMPSKQPYPTHVIMCTNVSYKINQSQICCRHQCIHLSKKIIDVLSDSNVTSNDVVRHFPEIQILQDGTLLKVQLIFLEIFSSQPHTPE